MLSYHHSSVYTLPPKNNHCLCNGGGVVTRRKSEQGFFWMRLVFSKHRSSMQSLTYAERGVYQELMWMQCEGKALPNDARKLARLLGNGCDAETITDLMEVVGDEFDIVDGFLEHRIVREQREHSDAVREKRRAARLGGKVATEPKGGDPEDAGKEGGDIKGHNCDPQGAQCYPARGCSYFTSSLYAPDPALDPDPDPDPAFEPKLPSKSDWDSPPSVAFMDVFREGKQ